LSSRWKRFDLHQQGLFNMQIPIYFALGTGVSQINLGEAKDQQ
jgi:hypothetical protein